jgi:hypothetical protein
MGRRNRGYGKATSNQGAEAVPGLASRQAYHLPRHNGRLSVYGPSARKATSNTPCALSAVGTRISLMATQASHGRASRMIRKADIHQDLPDPLSTQLNGIPSRHLRRSFFRRPCSECCSSAPKVYRRWHSQDLTKGRGALTAGGRLDAVDRIGEYLKAILVSLETWPEPGISADFPREQPRLRRQCRRAVISDMFNPLYRCLEAAGAIEDLDAAAAHHFAEWLPRNIVVAP